MWLLGGEVLLDHTEGDHNIIVNGKASKWRDHNPSAILFRTIASFCFATIGSSQFSTILGPELPLLSNTVIKWVTPHFITFWLHLLSEAGFPRWLCVLDGWTDGRTPRNIVIGDCVTLGTLLHCKYMPVAMLPNFDHRTTGMLQRLYVQVPIVNHFFQHS